MHNAQKLLIFVLLLTFLAGIQKAIRMKLFVKEEPAPIKEEMQDVKDENDIINNSSIVAAITAAIATIMDEEKKPKNKAKASFVVKSIKRI